MTENRRTRQGRRKTDEWFGILVEAMSEGLGVLDERNLIDYFNPALCEMTGYSAEELIGRPLAEFFDETNGALLRQHLEAHAQGDYAPYEIGFATKDGRRIIIHVLPHPLYDRKGRSRGSFAIVTDVTERKRAEEQLRKLSAAVEQSPAGVIITDDRGNIEYANPRFCKQTGYSEAELVGQTPRRLQSGRTSKEIYQGLWGALLGGREWRGELQDRKKNGEFYWAYNIVSGIRNAQGEITHFVALQEDITGRKQAEEALRESAGQLRLLSEQLLAVQEQERKRVASDLHDGIGQYLNALKFGLQQAKPALCLAAMETGRPPPCLDPMSLIQDAIEEVRRVSADLRPAILDDLGILATVQWYCRRFQALYAGMEIRKDLDIQESDVPNPLKITIFRVLQEALTNVAKHAEAKLVRVRLAKTGNEIELAIADNGIAFEVAETLQRESPAQGFGLISMRERAKLSGGSFAIESFPGKGTTISARWPLPPDKD